MKSRWKDTDAKALVQEYVARGINADLAIRTYTTRILGQEPLLVLHGGGNTSVKTMMSDEDGSKVEVICVKGSGWDMGTIEPEGLPAVELAPLQRLAEFDSMSDEKMVAMQRRLLLDPYAPNPSIEAVLHAILPFKHVDHTHANAIVSLTNQPDGEALMRDLFPDAIIVPYVMPGFDLAKACLAAYQDNPDGKGMILLKHGIFTYADDPRQSYDDMIEMVTQAEQRLAQGTRQVRGVSLPGELASIADIAPILRGSIGFPSDVEGCPNRFVLDHRANEQVLEFCQREDLGDIVTRGNATPEHVLRIKRTGIALPAPEKGRLDEFASAVQQAVAGFVDEYEAYFTRNNARVGGDRIMLDPRPRLFYVPGIGIFTAGKTKKAAAVASDIAEATVDVITKAEAMSAFDPLPEADLFDIEYWSLEQAKLAKSVQKPMTGQVVVVTGAAGGLGLEIAGAFKAEGADVAMLDIAQEAVEREAGELGCLAVACDVTDTHSVEQAIAQVSAHFGGIDVLVSNAGAAFEGAMLEVEDQLFEKAFALNFWGHHYMARSCVRVMQTQSSGGALVFNVSKQALNPGVNFGPYGTSKAALMALMRQYAIEHGAEGITSNAVNADRIRTGLLTDDFIAKRADARGVSPTVYMRGNLVQREVTAKDVADAFVHLAKASKTSGAVVTVDGGNVAAMVR